MATSLADLLARKKELSRQTTMSSLQTMSQGQKGADDKAAKMVENKRVAESKKFNVGNALVAGTTALVTSGGNPFAAGLAAIGSARGKKFKPLESAVGGGVSGLTTGDLTLETIGKKENLPKLIPVLRQVGAPKKAVDALETFTKAEAAKDVITSKAKVASDKVAAKVESDKISEEGKNKRAALKAFSDLANKIKSLNKRNAFLKTKDAFVKDYLATPLDNKITELEKNLKRKLNKQEIEKLKKTIGK